MAAIVRKLRQTLVDHLDQATPEEIVEVVGALAGSRPNQVLQFSTRISSVSLARQSFAERVIKLDGDGKPALDPQDGPIAAVYDPLLDVTWPVVDLSGDELELGKQEELARDFRLFGLTDWRLPTVFELQSIVDRSRYNPAVDPAAMPVKSGYYWASEQYAPASGYRWCVLLHHGDTYGLHRSHPAFARAVRAGQPFEIRY